LIGVIVPFCSNAVPADAGFRVWQDQNLRGIYANGLRRGFCVYARIANTGAPQSDPPPMPLRLFRRALPALSVMAGMPLHAASVSGNASLTSDYVFRGTSQANEHAALQVGVRVDAETGLYGSAWASRIDFIGSPDAFAEIDYVVGARRKLGQDWVGDLNATWFTYAGASELNYLEWIATTTWRDRHWVVLGVSSDVFATRRDGVYVQTGVRVPLDNALRVELAGGYYWLDRAYARDYSHGQATLAWLPHPKLELRLTGHLTDHDARVLFGDLAGPRFEASLQASF
jgi:uncharacterized protein (TIGR02001 family)